MKQSKMRGITLLGMLVSIVIIVFIVLIAASLVPPYMQHYEIKDALVNLAQDPSIKQASKAKVQDLFERKLQVNSIHVVSGQNLEIEKDSGKTWFAIKYEVRVHLISNIDALLTFDDRVMVGENN